MTDKVMDFSGVIGATSGDKAHMLGKFLCFSLSNILIEKDRLGELCDSMGIPYAGGNRQSVSDAFRSATGDIRERILTCRDGEQRIYQAYCRDNEHSSELLSRELVKETMNRRTNRYEKLANIYFDRTDMLFGYSDLSYDEDVDAAGLCRKAEELFELYKRCVNRKQIETVCVSYLRSLEATKLSGNGHQYFVPRQHMEKVDVLKEFVKALGKLNHSENETPLTAYSFYIIDDADQRESMTEEFYLAVKKEILDYQKRADYLIQSGSTSPAVMERWVLKIQALEQKKRHYEEVLRRELDGLDDEFSTLKFLSQELSVRARNLRFRKAA